MMLYILNVFSVIQQKIIDMQRILKIEIILIHFTSFLNITFWHTVNNSITSCVFKTKP